MKRGQSVIYRRQRSKRRFGYFLLCIIILLVPMVPVLANNPLEQARFSVQILPPENQIDPEANYFDLLTIPGLKQTLELELTNHTEETLIIQTTVNHAATSPEGTILYRGVGGQPDNTLVHHLQDITHFQSLTAIPPLETVILPIEINLTSQPFDGIIAGGLFFSIQEEEEPQGGNVNFLIALIMRQGESVDPWLVLNGIDVIIEDGSSFIIPRLQNIRPAFINDLEINARITRDSDGALMFDGRFSNLEVAPNSAFPFQIDLGFQVLPEGDYTLALDMHSGHQSWERVSGFAINPDGTGSVDVVEEAPLAPSGPNMTGYIVVFSIITALVLWIGISVLISMIRRRQAFDEAQTEIVLTLMTNEYGEEKEQEYHLFDQKKELNIKKDAPEGVLKNLVQADQKKDVSFPVEIIGKDDEALEEAGVFEEVDFKRKEDPKKRGKKATPSSQVSLEDYPMEIEYLDDGEDEDSYDVQDVLMESLHQSLSQRQKKKSKKQLKKSRKIEKDDPIASVKNMDIIFSGESGKQIKGRKKGR